MIINYKIVLTIKAVLRKKSGRFQFFNIFEISSIHWGKNEILYCYDFRLSFIAINNSSYLIN